MGEANLLLAVDATQPGCQWNYRSVACRPLGGVQSHNMRKNKRFRKIFNHSESVMTHKHKTKYFLSKKKKQKKQVAAQEFSWEWSSHLLASSRTIMIQGVLFTNTHAC